MDDKDKIKSAFRDIVQYEQTIGDLLSNLSTKNSEINLLKEQISSINENISFSNIENTRDLFISFMKIISDQNKKFEEIYTILNKIITDRENIPTELLDETQMEIKTYNKLLEIISTGRIERDIKAHAFDMTRLSSAKLVRTRGKRLKEDTAAGRTGFLVKETSSQGVHSIVLPFPEVSMECFRSVAVSLRSDGIRFVRIRVRDSLDWRAFSEVTIDLKNAAFHQSDASRTKGKQNVDVQMGAGGWVKAKFVTRLKPSDGHPEIELITLNRLNAKSSKKAGATGKGFYISDAVVEEAVSIYHKHQDNHGASAGLSTPHGGRNQPQTEYKLKTPDLEKKRSALRRAYMSSDAYARIAALRNIHAGKRAFIIGNGPSINRQNLKLLNKEITFVTNWFVNHPDYKKIRPTYYCVSSHEMFGGWGNPEPKLNDEWVARIRSKDSKNSTKFFSFRFKDYIEKSGVLDDERCHYLLFDKPKYEIDLKNDINLDLSHPMDDGYTGVMTFCLPLAFHMGIREIYLLGVDSDYGLTRPDAAKEYFYDYALHPTRTTKFDNLKRIWRNNGPVFRAYRIVKERFDAEGIRIVNCTDGGRLNEFPRARFEDVIGQPSHAR